MSALRHPRLRASLLLLGLTLAMGVVPQFARSNPVSAQTSTGTAGTGTPVTTATTPTGTGTATVGITTTPTGTGTATVGTPVPTRTLFTICGPVTAYTAASSTTGSITIGGLTFAIASGATFTGPTITRGNTYCLQFFLTSSGQIASALVTVSTATTATLNVCGTVTTFTAATSTATGTVVIAGQTFVIASGTTLTGATPTIGGAFCLSANLNTSGQITAGSFAAPLAATPFDGGGGVAARYRVGRSFND